MTQPEPHPPENNQAPRYVTSGELISRTKISLSTLHRYVKQGRLPYFQPGGKGAKLLFPPNAVEIAATAMGGAAHRDAPTSAEATSTSAALTKLPGPRPRWQNPQVPQTSRKGTM